ncbi:hypothetical protein EMIHUDRAFT_230404 [Emiliania huxleyi CCMP1516]|uniref:Uncharacterized protein n=2 Tax=Emiliania huxleyi TaxID=2903 RepID=A0A0D3KAL6_EMIH1|nr:hypothetical protein EMIHUDRAFT_230404 [Emiliania huxleyi CCMP1516]EOD32801.1 hypothetical protein EMIHUDRAFT_230404 [Emiliania huxleyi CCMP1516]|eukprot:XP_005785230.1 hypothetical protein EMIHUDRAFT_230404 [Emiliania huxleyi CCMP1516]
MHQLKAYITQFVHGIRILLFARVGVYRRFVNDPQHGHGPRRRWWVARSWYD